MHGADANVAAAASTAPIAGRAAYVLETMVPWAPTSAHFWRAILALVAVLVMVLLTYGWTPTASTAGRRHGRLP